MICQPPALSVASAKYGPEVPSGPRSEWNSTAAFDAERNTIASVTAFASVTCLANDPVRSSSNTEVSASPPSIAVPYSIVITGGTQRYAGAAGSCRMDNHLHQIRFGLQDDFGAFVCNLSG